MGINLDNQAIRILRDLDEAEKSGGEKRKEQVAARYAKVKEDNDRVLKAYERNQKAAYRSSDAYKKLWGTTRFD